MEMKAPLWETIKKYSLQGYTSFHMPVHGGGRALPAELAGSAALDVTELDATDNLANPKGCIKKAHFEAAKAFGCEFAHYMVGGSTSGIHAMFLGTCKRGDTVLVDRCAHMSVLNACAMYDLKPAFIERDVLPIFSIAAPLKSEQVTAAIKKTPHAKAVLITSPTYYGVCSDIASIAEAVHRAGMLLLVDSAHGSHFAFCDSFPATPIQAGADLCTMSLHKTLGALTQTAILLGNGGSFDKTRLKMAINMVQTSSPSYLLMSVADYVLSDMQKNGQARLSFVASQLKTITDAIYAATACRCLPESNARHDPLRLVVNFSAYDTSGYEIADILHSRYLIDVEMSDLHQIVCIVSHNSAQDELQKLKDSIIQTAKTLKPSTFPRKTLPLPPIEMRLDPSDAFFAETEQLPLEECKGRIAAANVSVYPPGVPVIVCGSEITNDTLDYISTFTGQGGKTVGIDSRTKTLVVKQGRRV